MNIEDIIGKLQEAVDIGDSPHRGPFDTNIRKEYLVEAIALLRTQRAMHNELCLQCGNYKRAHLGACSGCRWRKEPDNGT